MEKKIENLEVSKGVTQGEKEKDSQRKATVKAAVEKKTEVAVAPVREVAKADVSNAPKSEEEIITRLKKIMRIR